MTAFRRSIPFVVLALVGSTSLAEPAAAQHPDEPEHQHAERHHHAHAEASHGLHGDGFHHDFSDAERWAKVFDAPERVEWQKPVELMQVAEVDAGMTIVDLGAGTGFLLGYLSTAVGDDGRVLGLDVADSLVDHMRERATRAGWSNVEVRRIPTDDPELAAASVDRIFVINTWHHIDDRPSYAAKLLRTLRPGGSIVIVDYTLEAEHGPPKAHRLSPGRVIRELEAGGLSAEEIDEPLPRQYVVIGRRP